MPTLLRHKIHIILCRRYYLKNTKHTSKDRLYVSRNSTAVRSTDGIQQWLRCTYRYPT